MYKSLLSFFSSLRTTNRNNGYLASIIIIIVVVIICKFLVRLLRYEHRYITTVQTIESVKDQKSFNIKNRTKSVLSAVFRNPVDQQRRAEGPPAKLVAQR